MIAERFYALLLLAFPRGFRARYAEPMRHIFRERLRAKIAEERRKHDPLELGLEPAARSPSAPPLDLEAYKKKYERKVREIIVTSRLEQTLTKPEILELYLN